jgi:hypothetical protein
MEQVLYTTLSTAGTANHPQQFYVRISFHTSVSCLTKKISFVPEFNETSSEVYWVLLSKGTHPIK